MLKGRRSNYYITTLNWSHCCGFYIVMEINKNDISIKQSKYYEQCQ